MALSTCATRRSCSSRPERASREALRHPGPPSAVGANIRDALAELIYKQTGRRPMILPVVLEV